MARQTFSLEWQHTHTFQINYYDYKTLKTETFQQTMTVNTALEYSVCEHKTTENKFQFLKEIFSSDVGSYL